MMVVYIIACFCSCFVLCTLPDGLCGHRRGRVHDRTDQRTSQCQRWWCGPAIWTAPTRASALNLQEIGPERSRRENGRWRRTRHLRQWRFVLSAFHSYILDTVYIFFLKFPFYELCPCRGHYSFYNFRLVNFAIEWQIWPWVFYPLLHWMWTQSKLVMDS